MPGRVTTVTLHPLLAFKPDTYIQESTYSQCALEWDVRLPPHTARIVPTPAAVVASSRAPPPPAYNTPAPSKSSAPLPRSITPAELAQSATTPPVRSLNLTCGILPPEWRIRATTSSSSSLTPNAPNATPSQSPYVTVADVLAAIHTLLAQRVSHAEWERLAPKESDRVARTFHARWRCADGGDEGQSREYYGGVRRVDWVLHATAFAGLTCVPAVAASDGDGASGGEAGRRRKGEVEVVITLRREKSRKGEKKGTK
ncbi:hypothetical protein CONPUDRAFT_167471 [Coniophora puteana RWD-64-598 SS2]|uniref:DUF6699 domain-containing protein n=1 Tax=Coniophora puteana (strain RWD-64-598) TaxID=741705 RepID=A0A5M3MGV5_CONPW|nr:uncharacterized protein CONPUDRAFT_167471 [Coniophora puteana RWD-64-598 SS2]EIW78468.1 hypothetical protein CONPUDRAFT_167471 [Coniophora puteana RWD-64-598 SS2]